MRLSQKIQQEIAAKRMLLHPLYQKWQAGDLTLPELQMYATQYYHHVNAFPRYVSSIHSWCEDDQSRKLLFENLTDEEAGEDNHPALWLRFAKATGCSETDVQAAQVTSATQNLITTFFKHTRAGYETGLAALYTYEHQIPEVATTKIAGLKEFYGITNKAGTQYFQVHKDMDMDHAQALEDLLDRLPDAKHQEALQAAKNIADGLSTFLDQFLMEEDSTEVCES